MNKESLAPPDPANWQVRSIGFVGFTVEPQLRVQREWWKEFTGEDPEVSTRTKTQLEEAGPSGSGRQLRLIVDQAAIRWTWKPAPGTDDLEEPLRGIGTLPEIKEEFTTLMTPWLATAPPIVRMGFVASLAIPVADHPEGYRLLNSCLSTVDVDPESSDFLYRINRRRQSQVKPSLKINQLTTWMVGMFVAVLIAGPGPQEPPPRYYAALDLDVNTHQDWVDPFAPEERGPLWRELGDLAVRRAKLGDTRD